MLNLLKKLKRKKKTILPSVKNDQETSSLTAIGTKMACYMQDQMTVRQFS